MFNDWPLATDHGAEFVVFAAPVLLQVTTAHHHHPIALVFKIFWAASIKSVDLGIPKMEHEAPKTFGFADHDVMATVAPFFALPSFDIRWRDQKSSKFLHAEVEKNKGQADDPNGPADPAWDMLAGNT